MKVRGQFQTAFAFLLWKARPPVPIVFEAGLESEFFWLRWHREEFLPVLAVETQ